MLDEILSWFPEDELLIAERFVYLKNRIPEVDHDVVKIIPSK